MNEIRSNLLGICIPTLIEGLLVGCIKSIINEVAPYDFPIYVSDNASSDDTELVMRELSKIYKI